jgi:hypothetical protein
MARDSFMSLLYMTNKPSWQDRYEEAILETDQTQRLTRILAAQRALNERLRELQADHGGTPEERQSLMKAMSGLQILRTDIS